jgi:hypothetical protein
MAIHEVELPNGYTMRFFRDDSDATIISPGAQGAQPPVSAPADDGTTKAIPAEHRPLPQGDTGRLRNLLKFFGLDGWGLLDNRKGR